MGRSQWPLISLWGRGEHLRTHQPHSQVPDRVTPTWGRGGCLLLPAPGWHLPCTHFCQDPLQSCKILAAIPPPRQPRGHGVAPACPQPEETPAAPGDGWVGVSTGIGQ